MTVAAWCKGCGRYVWLDDRWACDAGHAWDQMSQWYDPDTGQPVTPYWLKQPATPSAEEAARAEAAPEAGAPAPQPVAAAPEPAAPAPQPAAPAPEPVAPEPVEPAAAAALGTREAVLADIAAVFADNEGYRLQRGTDTDMVIDNTVADASWGTGKKKVAYEAVLKAVETEQTVYFWEMLKEQGGGLSFGGVEAESYSTFGTKRFGKKKEIVIGPGGKAVDYTWDYAATRRMVEDAVRRNGWRMKVVLRKKSAQY